MKTFLHPIVLFLLVFTVNTGKANHLLGTQITYKWVDTLVYDFYLTYYRDCKGVDFSNPFYYTHIRCESGSGVLGVTLKLKASQIYLFSATRQKADATPQTQRIPEKEWRHMFTPYGLILASPLIKACSRAATDK